MRAPGRGPPGVGRWWGVCGRRAPPAGLRHGRARLPPDMAEPPAGGGGEGRWQRSPRGPQVLKGSRPAWQLLGPTLPSQLSAQAGRLSRKGMPGTPAPLLAAATGGWDPDSLAGVSCHQRAQNSLSAMSSGPPWGWKLHVSRERGDAALELHADEQHACPLPGCLADARPGERGASFQTGLAGWLTAHSASSLSPCTEMI